MDEVPALCPEGTVEGHKRPGEEGQAVGLRAGPLGREMDMAGTVTRNDGPRPYPSSLQPT